MKKKFKAQFLTTKILKDKIKEKKLKKINKKTQPEST